MLRGLYRTSILHFLLVGFLLTQRAQKSAIHSEQIAKDDLQPSRGALIESSGGCRGPQSKYIMSEGGMTCILHNKMRSSSFVVQYDLCYSAACSAPYWSLSI
jgi:hypothetical protein